jgi:hypothetical protein
MWTLEEASAYFAESGIPVEPRRLAAIIRALEIRPAGEGPSSHRGGRGRALYWASDLQKLHRDLAEWLMTIAERRTNNA